VTETATRERKERRGQPPLGTLVVRSDND
jgi:hypothetical protein